jgi:DNA-binding transcriptional regulator GbsR (MarR family)
LGFTAFRVWNLLRSRDDLTVREIAEALRMPDSQVRSTLKDDLEEFGLAEQSGKSRWSIGDRDLNSVADDLGVLQRPDLRARSFELQRSNRNQALMNARSRTRFNSDSEYIQVDFTTGEIIEEIEEDLSGAAALFSELLD